MVCDRGRPTSSREFPILSAPLRTTKYPLIECTWTQPEKSKMSPNEIVNLNSKNTMILIIINKLKELVVDAILNFL